MLLLCAFTSPHDLLPTFENVTDKLGIGFTNAASHTSRKYLPETMGGGVAIFDYDHDGRLDLFFVNGAAVSDPMHADEKAVKSDPKYWNRLYRNCGGGRFEDVTDKAGLQGIGYGMGVAAADYDNDGNTDLYVTGVGGNQLFHNNGDGTFSDVSRAAAVVGAGWSTGAMFLDYDRDGLLDLFVARYLNWDFTKDIFCGDARPGGRVYCHPDQFPPASHLLFHNEGHGRFKDVSVASGIAKFTGKGLGVAFNDYDHDGWPDIAVANDSAPEQIFHNLKNGTFEEVATTLGAGFDENGNTFAGMGIDFADYDNDGWPDLFINDLARQKYALFHNQEGRSFDYVSGTKGIAAATIGHSGWGAKFIDYDNDGLKDIFVGQGHVMDNIEMTQPDVRYREAPMLLRNIRDRFVDVSAASGATFHRPLAARGVAFGDLNGDGFVDVAINCNNERAAVLQNSSNSNHWIVVEPVGTKSNRDGIGTQVKVVGENGQAQFAVVSTASSYLSASDRRVYFGLGASAVIEQLELRWPSGVVQELRRVKSDQVLTVREASN